MYALKLHFSHKILLGLIAVLLIAALAVAPAVSHAAPAADPGSYDISWRTVDGGGATFIRHGKGSKPREVYLGKKSRAALRKYLKDPRDMDQALWVTHPR